MNIKVPWFLLSNFAFANRALLICLTAFPVFLLTLRGWMTIILIVTAVLATYILIRDKKTHRSMNSIIQRWHILLVYTLASPIVAVFLGQLFRLAFAGRNYDSPLRILLCVPILWVIIQKVIPVVKYLSYSIPLSIFITLLSVLHQPHIWFTHERITTYFVDPLTFGSINFSLGLFCLLSINLYTSDTPALKIYKLMGLIGGGYLSILSGSRTGWFALPIVLFLWLQFRTPNNKISAALIALLAAFAFSIACYSYSPVVQHRVDLAINEALMYQWNDVNNNTAEGMRISFLRIAWFLLLQNPLGGWGDQGFHQFLNAPALAKFATQFTQEFVFKAGFHNEIATNMVRSGIWGLLSSSALFLVPAYFFARHIGSSALPTRRLAILSLGYLICVFVSAMSTEVFNLKYTASFHALMITCLSGSLLVSLQSTPSQAAHES